MKTTLVKYEDMKDNGSGAVKQGRREKLQVGKV